jgi:hypothetical protein
MNFSFDAMAVPVNRLLSSFGLPHDDRVYLVPYLNNSNESPDIYHFILDAFGHSDTLKVIYNFDNSAFIDGPKKRGFIVPAGSRSNYQMTCLSLPSP